MEWKSAQKKSKIMTNSMNSISADISMNGQKLEEVTSFKYLGATLCKDGTCSAEVLIRIAIAMARLKRIRQCNITSLTSQFKLYKSLVTSILFYGCETWTLLADSEKKEERRSRHLKPSGEETSLHLLLGAQDQQLGVD